MVKLIDSHCHLDLILKQQQDLNQILHQAQENDVGLIQTICTKLADLPTLLEIANNNAIVYCSFGIHPLNVDANQIIQAQDIADICNKNSKIIAIGETGLDYAKIDSELAIHTQKENFLQHIYAAQVTGLPLIVHSRGAEADTVALLKQQLQKQQFRAVIHCFTGSAAFASECLELGLYISASGVLTFRNADDIRQIFASYPQDRILIETDAPYLSPTPFRGRMNTPAYLKHTALCLGQIRNLAYQEIADVTTQNFYNLFGIQRGTF